MFGYSFKNLWDVEFPNIKKKNKHCHCILWQKPKTSLKADIAFAWNMSAVKKKKIAQRGRMSLLE